MLDVEMSRADRRQAECPIDELDVLLPRLAEVVGEMTELMEVIAVELGKEHSNGKL